LKKTIASLREVKLLLTTRLLLITKKQPLLRKSQLKMLLPQPLSQLLRPQLEKIIQKMMIHMLSQFLSHAAAASAFVLMNLPRTPHAVVASQSSVVL
jgi:hypothetical protein